MSAAPSKYVCKHAVKALVTSYRKKLLKTIMTFNMKSILFHVSANKFRTTL